MVNHPTPEASAPRASPRLSDRLISGGLIAVAGVAGLVALYLPWHHFEPPSGLGLPPDPHTVIPIDSLSTASLTVLAWYAGPQWVVIASGFGLMLLRGRQQRLLTALLGAFASLVGFIFVVLFIEFGGFLNDSVYHIVVDGGAYLALAGFAVAFFGCVAAARLAPRSRTEAPGVASRP